MTDMGSASSRAVLSQSGVVIEGIKRMITSRRLQPGSRLPVEKDLAEELGVSRGSLREGVRALVILGVLDTRQGDGTYVTALDAAVLLSPLGLLAELQTPAEAVHMLALRRTLEQEVAAVAALHATAEDLAGLTRLLDDVERGIRDGTATIDQTIEADARFHHLVAVASGNPAFTAMVDGLVSRTARARTWRALRGSGALLRTIDEHRAVLTELIARDPDRARLRMSVHLLGVEEYTIAHLADQCVAEGTP